MILPPRCNDKMLWSQHPDEPTTRIELEKAVRQIGEGILKEITYILRPCLQTIHYILGRGGLVNLNNGVCVLYCFRLGTTSKGGYPETIQIIIKWNSQVCISLECKTRSVCIQFKLQEVHSL